MSRFKTALLAAAAAAVVAIAVVALPAIGDSGSNGEGHSEESALAACLAAHGLSGAPTSGPELKAWLVDKEAADPAAVKAAIVACDRGVPDLGATRPDVQAMITCVRSHGLDAPSAPEDFKRWVGERQRSKALQEALTACKMALAPAPKPGSPAKPDCGAATEKTVPPTDKPNQPASPSDTNGK